MFLRRRTVEGGVEMDASTQREVPANFTRELGRAVTFLHRSRARFMNERLRDLGFSGAMYLILLHIERHPGATQDSIANHMFINKCNVARRTKKLETLGYLYRETDQNDRRQNNLYLTQRGRELTPVIRRYMSQWGREVSASLSDQECATLIALLTKMTGQNGPHPKER